MKLTFLGSGTSHGIPVIACSCPCCVSSDPHDKRLRSSVLISHNDTNILVDCGPEFRIQALRANITKVNAVLLTHSHADHLHGIDDLRVFACLRSKDDPKKMEIAPLPIYGNEGTLKDFRSRFDYLFKPVIQGGGRALVELKETKGSENFEIGGVSITPVPMLHGNLSTNGYIFRTEDSTFIYLTDCSAIPEESIELIKSFGKIDHLIIDGLRIRPHSTHFSFSEALAVAEEICAEKTWLTHICHESTHSEIKTWISENLKDFPKLQDRIKKGGTLEPAFDGLVLE